MDMKPNANSKLHELRSKTNRELVSLISNKLDRGLDFVRMHDADERAEEAYEDVCAWMPLLDEAALLERRRLEVKLSQLRAALHSQTRVHAAC
jgi:hypothetical protein